MSKKTELNKTLPLDILTKKTAPKMPKIYAVKRGRDTGIFATWDECKSLTQGFPDAIFKGFRSRREAESFLLDDNETCGQRSLTTEEKLKIKLR